MGLAELRGRPPISEKPALPKMAIFDIPSNLSQLQDQNISTGAYLGVFQEALRFYIKNPEERTPCCFNPTAFTVSC